MKIEWQPDDIHPGRRVGKIGRIEQWMISYFADRPPAEAVRYALVSLSDGMIQSAMSAEAMAHHLSTPLAMCLLKCSPPPGGPWVA